MGLGSWATHPPCDVSSGSLCLGSFLSLHFILPLHLCCGEGGQHAHDSSPDLPALTLSGLPSFICPCLHERSVRAHALVLMGKAAGRLDKEEADKSLSVAAQVGPGPLEGPALSLVCRGWAPPP